MTAIEDLEDALLNTVVILAKDCRDIEKAAQDVRIRLSKLELALTTYRRHLKDGR